MDINLKGILGGATSGAATGTAVCPGWGTAIGAVAGGVLGIFSGDKSKKASENKQVEQAATTTSTQQASTQQAGADVLALAMSLVGKSGSSDNAIDLIKNLGLDSFTKTTAASTETAAQ